MSKLHVKYLLVGGGLASWSAAQAIRSRDPEGSVLLVGQEINRPYHRPPLSKGFLRREVPREKLFAAEPGWFEANRIELRTSRRVAHLDITRGAATLDNAEEVSFDKLLLAMGASANPLATPGADLPNVFTLRTLDDDAQLHNAIEQARREGRTHDRGRGRAVVIGAGLLGVEVAGSLAKLGLSVDLLASRALPWNRYAGETTGKFLTRLLERHHVTVHAEARPLRLEGDGRVQRVVLSPGRHLDCDFVVAAVGASPNKDILRGTPIAAEKAILADERCRTNVPDVYAAGDCCALLDPLFGKYRWIDHWENALITGVLAGRNMTGANEAYDVVSSFTSEVCGITLTVWGDARFVDRRLVRGAPKVESPEFVEIGVGADGRVAQIVAVGHPDEAELLRGAVARRLQIDGNLELLKDPTVPLREVLQ